jgi:hypothetical protein
MIFMRTFQAETKIPYPKKFFFTVKKNIYPLACGVGIDQWV